MTTPPEATVPQPEPAPLDRAELIAAQDKDVNHTNRVRRFVGHALLAVGLVVGVGAALEATSEVSSFDFTPEMPFIAPLQNGINEIDNALEAAGAVVLPAAIIAVGGVKMIASHDKPAKPKPEPKSEPGTEPESKSTTDEATGAASMRRMSRRKAFADADRLSSSEMTSDRDKKPGVFRKTLESVGTGSVPVLASIAAGLAAFSVSAGLGVSDGPEKPIVKALTTVAKGNQMIVQYDQAIPMVRSAVKREVANRILILAAQRSIRATILEENLGETTIGNQTRSDLTFGVEVAPSDPLYWNQSMGCNDIPVAMDSAAHIDNNSHNITNDGNHVNVVKQIQGYSAINRIGELMDLDAATACLDQDANSPVHAVVLDTTKAEASAILAEANPGNMGTAEITKGDYLKHSSDFWKANAKPITNVMALLSGFFSFVAMGGAVANRMTRNRRELAMLSSRGMTDKMVRGTELLRAAKDGIVATAIGCAGSFLSPVILNAVESGFTAGIGPRELAVAAFVGIAGPVGGALKVVRRPQKIIKTEQNTRPS